MQRACIHPLKLFELIQIRFERQWTGSIGALTVYFSIDVIQHLRGGIFEVSLILEAFSLCLEINVRTSMENGHRAQLGRFRSNYLGSHLDRHSIGLISVHESRYQLAHVQFPPDLQHHFVHNKN